MKALIGFMVLATTLLPRLSCVNQVTSVELRNNTAFPVEARLFISDQQDIPESIIDDVGDKIDLTVPAGQTQTISRDCDKLQAIKVRGDLQVIGSIGPSDSTGVFRDGTDFNCGNTMRFTFTASDPPVTLNTSFSVR